MAATASSRSLNMKSLFLDRIVGSKKKCHSVSVCMLGCIVLVVPISCFWIRHIVILIYATMPGPYRRVPGEEVRAASAGPAAVASAPSSGNSSASASLSSPLSGASDSRTPSERLLDKAYAREFGVLDEGQ